MPRKPRIPKPWQRKSCHGDWYVTVRQKQYYLAPADATEGQVQKALAQLLLMDQAEAAGEEGAVEPLLEKFLLHCRANQAPKTFRLRRDYLQDFTSHLESKGLFGIAVKDLRPLHVSGWLDTHPTWGPTSRRMAMTSVSTALNWAKDEGYIEKHPLERKLKLPPTVSRGRESYIAADIYEEWLGFCRHKSQRYALMALWHTGCRPSEICSVGVVKGTGYNRGRRTLVVCGKKTKGRPDGLREVALTPLMVELCEKLAGEGRGGAFFRNSRGTAWRPAALLDMFTRFRKKSVKRHPERKEEIERWFPYAVRHTFATGRLKEGWNDTMVARQLGHSSTEMLQKHYSHILIDDVAPLLSGFGTLESETL